MARPDASLHGEVGLDTSKLQRGVKQADGALRNLSNAMTAVGSTFAVYGIERAVNYAMELGKLGAQSLRLKASFEQLAESHKSNSNAILDSLKKASQGTISETDLILSANRAMMLGLGGNAEQLGDLLEVAAFRARAMGISTQQAFSDIVTGIGRKSPLILDNLGIVGLKMDDTTSKAEIMAQVITEGQKMIAEAGGMTRDAAAEFEILDAKLADLNTRWAELVAVPVTTKTVNFITTGLDGWEKAVKAVEDMQQLMPSGGAGMPGQVSGFGLTLPTPTLGNVVEGLKAVASPQLYALGLMWGAVTSDGFQQAVGQGIAGAITTVVGPQIQQSMQQVTQQTEAASLSLRQYYEYLVRHIDTVEVGSQRWQTMRGEIAKAAVLLSEFGDTATLDQMEGDVTEIYNMMGDGWPRAIRQALWEMLPMEQRLANMDAWAKQLKGTLESIRPSYGDYSTAEQFGPKATAQANLALLNLDVTIARAMERANRSAADDFRAKMEGANNIISGDIAEKVNAALGITDPTRGGPLDQGDAPGEWWRRLGDVAGGGENSPWAAEMRGEIAQIADYIVGPGAGEKVLQDEGAMKAGADAILRFADQFGTAGAAGAIQLNTGVVTIDWAGAQAGMTQQTALGEDVQAGTQFAAQQMGIDGDQQLTAAAGALGGAMGAFAGTLGGGIAGAAPGAAGAIGGSPLATMNTDAQALAQSLTGTLLPALTTINDFFTVQLNVQLSLTNTMLGTDMPTSLVTAGGAFQTFVSDALEPAAEAASVLNQELQNTISLLEQLRGYGFDTGGLLGGVPSYQHGGMIGKNVGDPVWILAHENEMVLNPDQQARVADLIGSGGLLPYSTGDGDHYEIHLHVGAMLGREADAYRLANELLPHLNRARRVQKWD